MKGRPAESLTGAGAIGALVAFAFGVQDPQVLSAIIAGLGLLPAVVSLLVSNGGVMGVLRLALHGRAQEPPAA